MFLLNNNVKIVNNKIIAGQSTSTPGVYKTYNIEHNKNYIIKLIEYDNKNKNTKLWLADINNKLIYFKNIEYPFLYFSNKKLKKIKVGVLFSGKFCINDYFFLDDIILYEIIDDTPHIPFKEKPIETPKNVFGKDFF